MIAKEITEYLLTFPAITSKVGFGTAPFIWYQSPGAVLEGSQSAGLVVSYSGFWATANHYNTLNFPRIRIDFIVDAERIDGNVSDPTKARRHGFWLFLAVDEVLNFKDNPVFLTTEKLVSSVRSVQPEFKPSIESDGTLIGTAFYNIEAA